MTRRFLSFVGATAAMLMTGATALGGEAIETTLIASAMIRPIGATHAPGDYRRLYINEKRGVIRVWDIRNNTEIGTMLNIDPRVTGGTTTNDERGLLGVAFHPDFRTNGLFYVNYTGTGGRTTVSQFSMMDDGGVPNPDVADPTSEVILLTIPQPFSNHNGGWIAFGPNDGYLYIGTGDGGSAGDPGNRAQDRTDQLLGKMLRIDVNTDDFPKDPLKNYGIPPSNPYVMTGADDELWAFGLRNPWRNSFDRDTGDLLIADVGQNSWEELDFQPFDSIGGENYGWRCMEGEHCTGLSGCVCFASDLVLPFHEYGHGLGRSITGGYVYRGCDIPTLDGTYIFGDYTSGRLWSIDDVSAPTVVSRTDLSPSREGVAVNQIASFGEDARGEIYIIDQGSGTTGQVFKIVPVDGSGIRPADLDCNGVVEFADLLRVLGVWGPCDYCIEDINNDEVVDFADLILVLADWG